MERKGSEEDRRLLAAFWERARESVLPSLRNAAVAKGCWLENKKSRRFPPLKLHLLNSESGKKITGVELYAGSPDLLEASGLVLFPLAVLTDKWHIKGISKTPAFTQEYFCDACGEDLDEKGLFCFSCPFDLCSACGGKGDHPHPLSRIDSDLAVAEVFDPSASLAVLELDLN